MELKNDDVKKAQKIEQPKVSKVRAFATAAVLAGGLALFGSAQAKAEGRQDMPQNLDCGSVQSVNLVCKANKSVVKAGDPLVTVEFIFEKAGFFSFMNVTKVDAKGIEIDGDVGRVNFGETKFKTVGEFVIKEVVGAIKAEKGPKPGTAIVTIQSAEEAQAERMDKIRTKLDCVPGINIACAANKSVVQAGDPIMTIEFLFEKAGYFSWDVTKVDAKGIEIDGGVGRVNFGDMKALGDGAVIKVEKGPKPGTAVVTVEMPKEGYTEVKKTAEKMRAGSAE